MEKLMITNCAADTQMYPGVPKRFDDSETLAKSVEAGGRGWLVRHGSMGGRAPLFILGKQGQIL